MARKQATPTRGETATVASTVDKLRLQLFSAAPGEYLGSEDHLAQVYGVSRPTMRQAVVVLSQEGLLEARRGARGGFFAKRPDATAITHNTSIYLRTQGTKVEEIMHAIEPLRVDMTVLAAANRDPRQLDEWIAFRERDRALRESGRYHDFDIAEIEFRRLLGVACRNRVLNLFMNTLHSLGDWDGMSDKLLADKPERYLVFWKQRAAALDAIIEGDTLLAGIGMRRALRLLNTWTLDDLRAARIRGEDDEWAASDDWGSPA